MSDTKNSDLPSWALAMLEQLKQLEISLGNIRPQGAWHSDDLSQLIERSFESEGLSASDETVDFLFRRIVKGLHKEGLKTDAISAVINQHLTDGDGLPYCSTEEVEEAL